jgi:hypothetical protein
VLRIRCFFTPGTGIRIQGPGWGEKSGSGMNIPDYFSESLETLFTVKNSLILWGGSGSGIFLNHGWKNSDPGYRKHPGSVTLVRPKERKTTFRLECVKLVTCLVHVGAGVADGGYGKLVLQPQTQHIQTTRKNVLRQLFIKKQPIPFSMF